MLIGINTIIHTDITINILKHDAKNFVYITASKPLISNNSLVVVLSVVYSQVNVPCVAVMRGGDLYSVVVWRGRQRGAYIHVKRL